jgi:hypothetical protein
MREDNKMRYYSIPEYLNDLIDDDNFLLFDDYNHLRTHLQTYFNISWEFLDYTMNLPVIQNMLPNLLKG